MSRKLSLIIKKDQNLIPSFKDSASILLAKVDSRFGVVIIKDGEVVKLMEKISDLALVRVHVFTKETFDAVENLKPSWGFETQYKS